MNKSRRKEIEKIYAEINDVLASIEEIQTRIGDVKYDEECAMDNTPESLQDTDRYREMEEWMNALEDCDYSLSDALSSIESALESLDSVE